MEHTFEGVRRTFPKKPSGPSRRPQSAPIARESSPIEVRKKPKKLSKAKKQKKKAIFAAKIERKKREAEEEFEEGSEVDVADMLSDDNEKDEEIIQNMTFNGEYGDNGLDGSDGGSEEGSEGGEVEGSEQRAGSDADDHDAFRQEIANMPMGKVKELKEKLGIKLFNKAFFGEEAATDTVKKRQISNNFSRENSKRPREMSSKRPVSKFRNAYANERIEKKRLDPRFDDRCGEFNDYIHRTNYGFLGEIREKEKQTLKKEIKKTEREEPEKAERMKETLRKINNREKSQAEADRRKEVVREVRRENNLRMQQGLKPVFKTRGELKMRYMEKKFDDLKKTNKLDKYIERRSKKQSRRGRMEP